MARRSPVIARASSKYGLSARQRSGLNGGTQHYHPTFERLARRFPASLPGRNGHPGIPTHGQIQGFTKVRPRYTHDLSQTPGDLMATPTMPSAEIVFDTMFAYQRSAALKSAIDLDLFTAIDGGATTNSALATE